MRLFFYAAIACLVMPKIMADDNRENKPSRFTSWGTYTYFYLDDGRPVGSIGTSHGQNAIYTVSMFLNRCTSFAAYGTYERTKTINPINQVLVDVTQQGFIHSEGWGAGGTLVYNILNRISTYVDYSYVWVRQNQETIVTNPPNVHHTIDGTRWKLSSGVNTVIPIRRYTLGAGANYNYIASSKGASTDDISGQQITAESGRLGIGNVNGALFLRPEKNINPFINAGISYDINRSQSPATLTNTGAIPVILTGTPRARFEWNAGAGMNLTTGSFSLAASYLHRQRSGPIKTDGVTVYLSSTF